MREIRFRAWDMNTKDWHIFKSADDIFGTHSGTRCIRFNRGDMIACQYTGLKDKNGKEIYEGDIVESMRQMTYDGKPNGSYRPRKTVKWVIGSNKVGFNIAQSTKYEVVGNVYESPSEAHTNQIGINKGVDDV